MYILQVYSSTEHVFHQNDLLQLTMESLSAEEAMVTLNSQNVSNQLIVLQNDLIKGLNSAMVSVNSLLARTLKFLHHVFPLRTINYTVTINYMHSIITKQKETSSWHCFAGSQFTHSNSCLLWNRQVDTTALVPCFRKINYITLFFKLHQLFFLFTYQSDYRILFSLTSISLILRWLAPFHVFFPTSGFTVRGLYEYFLLSFHVGYLMSNFYLRMWQASLFTIVPSLVNTWEMSILRNS